MKKRVISVIGLGYVGLPVSVAFSEAGYHVIGLDLKKDRVSQLNSNFDKTNEISKDRLKNCNINFTVNPRKISEANFHIVVGQVSSIRNIGRCIKSSGLQMGDITLEPLASSDAVLSEEEKDAGVALIDIGGGTTDVAIFKDGIIKHTAVIPFGGNVITQYIKEGCSIIGNQAEQLKIKFGSAWPGQNKDSDIVSIPGLRGRDPKEISLKTLSKIINARIVEIIEQAYLEIKNYGHEDSKKKLIAGIVLTGGGSQLRHLKQLTEYVTGMDTRIGFPGEHLAGDPNDYNPIFSTAVGLLMKAIEKNSEENRNMTSTTEKDLVNHERKTILTKWGEGFKKFIDNVDNTIDN